MDSIEALLQASVPARFEEVSTRFADRLAVKRDKAALTYEALNRASNRLAHAILEARGEGMEPVALLVDQGIPAVVGILGILKAGKFYVPLEKGLPPARLATILEDSTASLVLTDQRNLPLAQDLVVHPLKWMNLESMSPDLPETSPNFSIAPDAYLNIMYTSGSTGKPKGALQIQRNLLHAVYASLEYSPRSPEDRFLMLSSYSIGASAASIFTTLLTGGVLVIANLKEDGIDQLGDLLVEERITHFLAVPTVFRHLLGSLKPDEIIPDVRHISLGGEPVYRKDFDAFKRHFQEGCILRVGLGTTENYLATYSILNHQSEVKTPVIPVGYPVHGLRVLILDPEGRSLPPGEAGQIAIQSRYLAPGYWRMPELTRSVYLPDPAGGDERIHLTGDLGKISVEGSLEHLGRMDFQVKIRGHKIEPSEIEAAVLEHPGIREAVVVGLEKRPGEFSLVAYFIPEKDRPVSIHALRTNLREQLPEYMVPEDFVVMDRFPLLPFGKVDVRALPSPADGSEEPGVPLAEARTPAEQNISLIFSEVLGRKLVGIDENFFELGGSSLSAAQVVTRIREEMQIELAVTDILETPTVASLAERLAARVGREQPEGDDFMDEEALRRALDLLEMS